MPNLVGIWNSNLSEESVRSILYKQLQRVRVPIGSFTEHKATFPGFGMALQDNGLLENGAQPALSDDGETALLLDGEITNAAELARQFSSQLPAGVLSPPELCLHLILQQGPSVARFFNGFFCIIVYERKSHRMISITDRYAARPLYYVKRKEGVVFGSEMKALAAVDPGSRRIDELGILELFCYGTHFMDRTWMDGYRRLGPAAILTVDESGVALSRYWNYRYDEEARSLDQGTYSTVFGILFDRAVERCMGGTKRIGLFLSGGYDSRAVAAAIRKHRLPMPAFTFGLPHSRDARFGAMLASRLGLEHRVLTSPGPYLYQNCRSVVWRTEGMITFSNATSIQWHPVLKEKMDIILTGFLGEFGGSHSWPQLLLARSRQAAIDAIFNRFLMSKLALAKRIFQPEFFSRVFPAARDYFYKSFDVVENNQPLNIADSWNFLHVQPRGTFHAPAVDRHSFELRSPHTDNDLVDFLLTIPPLERLEQRVYKKMIAHSFPEIRDIPCTNSARPIDPSFAREYTMIVSRYFGRKVAGPIRTVFSKRAPLGREFRDVGEDFRAEPELMDKILRPLLREGIFPDSIFKYGAIEELIREHYEQRASHEFALGLLISFGMAAKYFLHDDFSDVPQEMYAR